MCERSTPYLLHNLLKVGKLLQFFCVGYVIPQFKCCLKDTVVAIMAEGKEVALAIGRTAMSTDEIASKNKERSPYQSNNLQCLMESVYFYQK